MGTEHAAVTGPVERGVGRLVVKREGLGMQTLKCPECGHKNPDIRELGHTLPFRCNKCPHIWRLQDVTPNPEVRSLVTLDAAVAAVVARHGGVRAAERATGVDKSFISRLMNGHKVAPSAETLEALGLRAVPLYEVLKTPNVRAEPPP